MICSAKVRRGKVLCQRRGEKRRESIARVAQIRQPVRDAHYVNFVNELKKDR